MCHSVALGARPQFSGDDIAALKAKFAIPTTKRKELALGYGILRASVHRICTAYSVSVVPSETCRELVRSRPWSEDSTGS